MKKEIASTIERIFSIILILFGALIVASTLVDIYQKTTEEPLFVDLIMVLALGVLPLYFGLKLYNRNK
tara:strand:+ start:2071 stop:2274 length:204 start_codon:yes stop_codon:yes gene_type:complete